MNNIREGALRARVPEVPLPELFSLRAFSGECFIYPRNLSMTASVIRRQPAAEVPAGSPGA